MNRSSCREFVGGEIPDEDISTLFKAMSSAPSAGNLQPWFFYVVKITDVKETIAKAAYGQKFIADAAVVFVICAMPAKCAQMYGKRGSELYCLQDTAAAVENLLIAADALDYGACWVGAFDEELVRKALAIEQDKRPVAIVPVGSGIKSAQQTPRSNISDICKTIG